MPTQVQRSPAQVGPRVGCEIFAHSTLRKHMCLSAYPHTKMSSNPKVGMFIYRREAMILRGIQIPHLSEHQPFLPDSGPYGS